MEVKVIGNIYVKETKPSEKSGVNLCFRQENEEKFILGKTQYVSYLMGNDTCLLVKAKYNGQSFYYKIKHNKGEVVFKVNKITSLQFEDYEQKLAAKYHFDSNEEE